MTREEITAVIAEFHRDCVVPEMDERERRLKAELKTELKTALRAELRADFRYEIQQLRADLPAMLIEFVTPEIAGVAERLGARIDALRDDTRSHFDLVHKRFDRLEITAAVRQGVYYPPPSAL